MKRMICGFLATVLLAACGHEPKPEPSAGEAAPPTPEEHRAEVEAFHAGRIEALRQPQGWLSLVGLYWLEEGENTFGAAADNDLVFPAEAGGEAVPPRIGVFHVGPASQVRLEVEDGVEVLHAGQPADGLNLVADSEGEATLLEVGSLRFFLIRRGDQVGVRVKDVESPLLASFEGIETFPIDPAWRLIGRFEPYDPPRLIAIPNVLGQVDDSPSPGAVVFEVEGKSYRLEPVGEPGEALFFIFGDATNGHETYGGGRFLTTPPPSPDGQVVLDFNQAINPPCVFTPYATCPLPPRQNKLDLRIEAGEKVYGAGH